MTLERHAYAAVRKPINAERECMLVDEIDVMKEMVQTKINNREARIPNWHKANPAQRIVRVKITEVE